MRSFIIRRSTICEQWLKSFICKHSIRVSTVSYTHLIAFVCTSLFSSTREAVIEKNKWRNSENLIITQPHEDNNKYRGVDDRVEEDGSYLYYDIYDKKTLQLVKDNISQVIGYRYGLSLIHISLLLKPMVQSIHVTFMH